MNKISIIFCFYLLLVSCKKKDVIEAIDSPNTSADFLIPEMGEYQSYTFNGKASQGFLYNAATNFWEWGYKSSDWLEKSSFGILNIDGKGNYNLVGLKKIGKYEKEPFKKVIFTNYLNDLGSQGYYSEINDSCLFLINMKSPTFSGPFLFKKKKQ